LEAERSHPGDKRTCDCVTTISSLTSFRQILWLCHYWSVSG
jgi:hypothetical protein